MDTRRRAPKSPNRVDMLTGPYAQSTKLEQLLSNEVDLAFRWRVRVAFAYLDPQPGERILDCACGLGYHLMALSRLVPCRLYGLDRDRQRLAFARQGAPAEASLCLGDIYALPYQDACFDKVLLVEVLEHLEDDVAGLREVWRVLKPGGTVAVTVPHADYPLLYDPVNWLCERAFGRAIRRGPFAGIWTEHKRLYQRDGLLEIMRRGRFHVLEERTLTRYCLPFTHNLVYVVGKALLLGGKLPGFVSGAVDRFHPGERPRRWWNPMTWFMRFLERIDDLNVRAGSQAVAVNIAVKATKPDTSRAGAAT